MGYDLHITRRKYWPDEGDDITAQEWLAYVKQDSELRLQVENGPHFAAWRGASGTAWLDWSDGQIYTKNPDALLIEKMVSIARQFGAQVQGDDGEVYEGGGRPPRQPKPSFSERVAGWIARIRPKRPVPIVHKPLGFDVGDKVLDPWGNEHTVLAIDPQAEHGMGVIRTRRKDGTEHEHAMIAHGFKPAKNRGTP
jgi:hypothetical protein